MPDLAENFESGQDPPRVANVRLLFRSPVQTPRVALSFAKPPSQETCQVPCWRGPQPGGYHKGGGGVKGVTRMRLAAQKGVPASTASGC